MRFVVFISGPSPFGCSPMPRCDIGKRTCHLPDCVNIWSQDTTPVEDFIHLMCIFVENDLRDRQNASINRLHVMTSQTGRRQNPCIKARLG